MKFRLIGAANDSGIGNHYYHYARALLQIPSVAQHVELINYQDTAAFQQAAAESTPDDVTISFVGTYFRDRFRGHCVNWTVFETTVIPDALLNLYRTDTSTLWIPSHWGRDVAVANGVDPARIEVVPEGVDSTQFHPYLNPRPMRPYRFLTVGKYERRKSYTEILSAFARTFGNDPAVELVIKSGYFQDVERKGQEMVEEIRAHGCNNIRLLWSTQTPETLVDLYRTSDCFVFPTRAEGWGLPLIEAAASGLPVITTNYSAQTEFLKDIHSSCLFVDYDLVAVDCPEYISYNPSVSGDWGLWAEPSIDSIAQQMRQAYQNYAHLKLEAIKNSRIIRSNFSWANSVTASLDALKRRGAL